MEKERKFTKEEKEFQRDRLTSALAELNLKKKEKIINLERVTKHIDLGIPRLELEGVLEKNKGLLEREDVPELEKMKLRVEIELLNKELELNLATRKAEHQKNFLEKEIINIDKEVKATFELLKRFR